MKRIIITALALMLLVSPALGDVPLTPEKQDLPLEEILPLAQAAFQDRMGFSDAQAALFTLSAQIWEGEGADFKDVPEKTLRVWSVSFRYAPQDESAFLDEATNDLVYSMHLRADNGKALIPLLDDQEIFLSRYRNYQSLSADAEYQARRLEACQLAREYLMDACGMTEAETAPLIPRVLLLSIDWESPSLPIDYENAWWRVSFALPGLPEQPALILAVEAESRYTYLDAGNTGDFAQSYLGWLEWQQKWIRAQEGLIALSQQFGDPLFWGYEMKAGFYQEYGMAPDLTGEGAEISCDLPGTDDTSYDQALAAAKEACIQHLNADPAELDTLKISALFTRQFWHPTGERAWIFHFYAPHATSQSPDNIYTAFVVSPAGEAVTVMRTAQEPGDQDYWSVLDE